VTCLPYWFPFKSINWLTLLVWYTQTGRWSHKTTFSFRKEITLTVSRGKCPHYQARKWFQLLNVLLRSARVNRGRGWRKPLKCQQRFRFVRAAYSEATNRIAQQPPKQLQQHFQSHSSPETGLVSWFWGFKTFWPYNAATPQDREEVHAFLFYRSAPCQQYFFPHFENFKTLFMLFVSMGWTVSLNCGHRRAYCLSPRWYMRMESNGEFILTGQSWKIVE
jgi:hypothetical protein